MERSLSLNRRAAEDAEIRREFLGLRDARRTTTLLTTSSAALSDPQSPLISVASAARRLVLSLQSPSLDAPRAGRVRLARDRRFRQQLADDAEQLLRGEWLAQKARAVTEWSHVLG